VDTSVDETGTTVVVASYDFVENQILAELYTQALRRAGVSAEVVTALGTREVVEPALEQGKVDLVVDYLGTALDFLVPATPLSHGTAEQVHAALLTEFAPRGVSVMPFAAAEDKNGFAVSAGFSSAEQVRRLSDLIPLADTLVLGGPPECPERRYCGMGLRQVYGLDFRTFKEMSTRSATATALETGEIDVGLLETTDPRLSGTALVLLEDDRGLQPRENVVPLVRTAMLTAYDGRIEAAIEPVTAGLTTAELIELNRAVEIESTTHASAAKAWLDRHPLTS